MKNKKRIIFSLVILLSIILVTTGLNAYPLFSPIEYVNDFENLESFDIEIISGLIHDGDSSFVVDQTVSTPQGIIDSWNFNNGYGSASCSECPENVAGYSEGGISFSNGERLIVQDSPSFSNLNSFSLSAWANPNDAANDWSRIISKADDTSGGDDYALIYAGAAGYQWNEKYSFRIRTSEGFKAVYSDRILPNTGWHHVVGTWDGNTIKLYVDGVLVDSENAGGQIIQSGENLCLGSHCTSDTRGFFGSLDEIYIFDHALSQEEINQLNGQGIQNNDGYFISNLIQTEEYTSLSASADIIGDVDVEVSTDEGSNWCNVLGVGVIDGTCQLPSSNFKYRVTINDAGSSIDSISFNWILEQASEDTCGDLICSEIDGENCGSCSIDCGSCELEPVIPEVVEDNPVIEEDNELPQPSQEDNVIVEETDEPFEEVECELLDAYWEKTNVEAGEIVSLILETNSGCDGEDANFEIFESDVLTADDPVVIDPVKVKIRDGLAIGKWNAELQDDGLFGGNPEYGFRVSVNPEIDSSGPLLEVVPPGIAGAGVGGSLSILSSTPDSDFTSNNGQTFEVEVSVQCNGAQCDNVQLTLDPIIPEIVTNEFLPFVSAQSSCPTSGNFFPPNCVADERECHPYIYMNDADVQAMKDNIASTDPAYDWADDLLADAISVCNSGGTSKITGSTSGHQRGRPLMACATAYLATDNVAYADKAADILVSYSSLTATEVRENFDFSQMLPTLPIAYDMIYDYLHTDSRLTTIKAGLASIADDTQGSYGHNQNFQEQSAEALIGLALGQSEHVCEIEEDFKSWYNNGDGDIWDGYFFEFGQALKHYYIVGEGQAYHVMATKRANDEGYTQFEDLMLWENSDNRNIVEDNWRMWVKFSNPKFQVPFLAMWRGSIFHLGRDTGIFHSLYALTGDDEWGAIANSAPSKKHGLSYWTTLDYYAGLAHGRQISSTAAVDNDQVRNDAKGFAVLSSGDPNGKMNSDQLHVFMNHGRYGDVTQLYAFFYGKGNKLTEARVTDYTDDRGERSSGGGASIFDTTEYATTSSTLGGGTYHVWETNSPDVKVMSITQDHRRTIGVTDDYFVDIVKGNNYDTTNRIRFRYDGIGSPTLSTSGPTSNDFDFTYSGIAKYHVLNDISTTISPGATSTNLYNIFGHCSGGSYVGTGISCDGYASSGQLLGVDDLSSEQLSLLQTPNTQEVHMTRNGLSSTRFVSIIEPLGGASSLINSVECYIGSCTGANQGIFVDGNDYDDYFVFAENAGTITLAGGGESISIDGSYGYIRYDEINEVVDAWGDISAFTINDPGIVSNVRLNNVPVTYDQSGGTLSYTGGVIIPPPTTPKGTVPVGSGEPFYISGGDMQNPYDCGTMQDGDVCTATWTVTTNGNANDIWNMFTYVGSDTELFQTPSFDVTIGDQLGCSIHSDCDSLDDANSCIEGYCNSGICETQAASDGTVCSDGVSCTASDVCSAGVCGGTPDVGLCSNPQGCSGVSCDLSGGCMYTGCPVPIMSAYWPLDASGIDSSGVGNNLNEIGNVNYVSGLIGNAADLGGESSIDSEDGDYFELSNAALVDGFPGKSGDGVSTNAMSFVAWVRADADKGMHVMGKDQNGGRSYSLARRSDGNVELQIHTPSQTSVVGGSLNVGAWNFIAFTYDGSSASVYTIPQGASIDLANQKVSGAVSGNVAESTTQFRLGYRGWEQYADSWNGLIDEAGIFDTALSDSDIITIYNNGLGSFGSCTDGETQECALQQGVCASSVSVCSGGSYPQCGAVDYGSDYEIIESICDDGLDNDCDGLTDSSDFDCFESTGSRGRVQVVNGNLVADNGATLRGEAMYLRDNQPGGIQYLDILDNDAYWLELRDEFNLNIVRLIIDQDPSDDGSGTPLPCGIAEDCFPLDYVLSDGRTVPEIIEDVIDRADSHAMYVMIDYHPVGGYDSAHAMGWWTQIAPMFAHRTNVLYEITNEPVRWGPDDYDPQDIQYQEDMYNLVRSLAPETHLIFWSFSHNTGSGVDMYDVVSQTEDVIPYGNGESVGFHPYGSYSTSSVDELRTNNIGVINTEIGGTSHNQYLNRIAEAESTGLSWIGLDAVRSDQGPFPTWYGLETSEVYWPADPFYTGGSIDCDISDLTLTWEIGGNEISSAVEGQVVDIVLSGPSYCNGESFTLEVREDDGTSSDLASGQPDSAFVSLINGVGGTTWATVYDVDSFPYFDADPEYFFRVGHSSGTQDSELLEVSPFVTSGDDTFYVSPSGTGDGSSAGNAMSLTAALTESQSRPDEVLTFILLDGIYGTFDDSTLRAQEHTWQSQNSLGAQFDHLNLDGSNIIFDGVFVDGSGQSNPHSVNIQGDDIQIINCEVKGPGMHLDSTATIAGIKVDLGNNILIQNCEVYDAGSPIELKGTNINVLDNIIRDSSSSTLRTLAIDGGSISGNLIYGADRSVAEDDFCLNGGPLPYWMSSTGTSSFVCNVGGTDYYHLSSTAIPHENLISCRGLSNFVISKNIMWGARDDGVDTFRCRSQTSGASAGPNVIIENNIAPNFWALSQDGIIVRNNIFGKARIDDTVGVVACDVDGFYGNIIKNTLYIDTSQCPVNPNLVDYNFYSATDDGNGGDLTGEIGLNNVELTTAEIESLVESWVDLTFASGSTPPGDFSLTSGSQAIDFLDIAIAAVNDFEGSSRVDIAGVGGTGNFIADAGAYEYGAELPQPPNVYYVSSTAIGGGDGSQGNEFTLNEAVDYSQTIPDQEATFILKDGNYGGRLVFSSGYFNGLATPKNQWHTWTSENPLGAQLEGATIQCPPSTNCDAYIRLDNINFFQPFDGTCYEDRPHIIHVLAGRYVEVMNNNIQGEGTVYNVASGVKLIHYPDTNPLDMYHLYVENNVITNVVEGVPYSGDDIRIIGNEIHHFHSSSIPANSAGGVPQQAGTVLIENNHIYDQNFFTEEPCYNQAGHDDYLDHGNGIGMRGNSDVTIRGNVLHNMWIGMIRFYAGDYYDVTIENNLMYDQGHTILIDCCGADAQIYGNVKFNHNTLIPGTQDDDWTPDMITSVCHPDLGERFEEPEFANGDVVAKVPGGALSTEVHNNVIFADFFIPGSDFDAQNNLVWEYAWNFGSGGPHGDSDVFEAEGTNYALAECYHPIELSDATPLEVATFIDTELFVNPEYTQRYHMKHCEPGSTECDFSPLQDGWLCNHVPGDYIGAFDCSGEFPAPALTYYVSVSGAGNHDGSLGNEFSLAEAITHSTANVDSEITYLLANGNYGTFSDSTQRTEWHTFKAQNDKGAVFDSISIVSDSKPDVRLAFEDLEVYGSGINQYLADSTRYTNLLVHNTVSAPFTGIGPMEQCTRYDPTGNDIVYSTLFSTNGADNLILEDSELYDGWYGIFVRGSDNIVRRNKIHQIGEDAIRIWGTSIDLSDKSNIQIVDNEIYNVGDVTCDGACSCDALTAPQAYDPHNDALQLFMTLGTLGYDVSNVVIQGNTLHDIYSQGIFISPGEAGVLSDVTVSENIVHKNYGSSFQSLTLNKVTNAVVERNTVVDGSISVRERDGVYSTGIVLRNNIANVWINYDSGTGIVEWDNNLYGSSLISLSSTPNSCDTTVGASSIVGNFEFVDASNGNYEPLIPQPGIDQWNCGSAIIGIPDICTMASDGGTVGAVPCSGSTPIGNCGNGIIDTGESCDDGDALSGDGCSASCNIETDYVCFGTPSVCTYVDPIQCVAALSSGWSNTPISSQTGQFEFIYELTPLVAAPGLDALVGLSDGYASSFGDMDTTVRFYTNGFIDVRDGLTGSYHYDGAGVSYNVGNTYTIRQVVDISSSSYDVYVTPSDTGVEVQIANDYQFRNGAGSVTQLDHWSITEDAATTYGSAIVCDAQIVSVGTATVDSTFSSSGSSSGGGSGSSTEVEQDNTVTFEAEVTCTGGDCGEVTVTLDPEVSNEQSQPIVLEDVKSGSTSKFMIWISIVIACIGVIVLLISKYFLWRNNKIIKYRAEARNLTIV